MSTSANTTLPTIRRPGRPRVLDAPATQAAILRAIGAGVFLGQAARFAGISEATFRHWRRRWREGDPEAVNNFAAFFEAMEIREAQAELQALKVIRRGDPGWLSSAWWLSRRFPQRWGLARLRRQAASDAPGDDLDDMMDDPDEVIEEGLDDVDFAVRRGIRWPRRETRDARSSEARQGCRQGLALPRRGMTIGAASLRASVEKVSVSHLFRAEKGRTGSTSAHWQIGLAYAKYLSDEFHSVVNEAFREWVEEKNDPALKVERAIDLQCQAGKGWGLDHREGRGESPRLLVRLPPNLPPQEKGPAPPDTQERP